MAEIVAIVLLVSCLFCYLYLGGVHLGGGILGAFSSGEPRKAEALTRSAGWELCQFPLLGVVGVLYFLFPTLFVILAGPLIVPFAGLLIFALCSGLALVLARYRTTSIVFFRVAAFGCPFCIGLVAGALVLGRLDTDYSGVYTYYVRPWLNFFCITLGLFMVSLFWFLAASYFSDRIDTLKKTAVGLCGVLLSFGGLVFVTGELYGMPLFEAFFMTPMTLVFFSLLLALWMGYSVWVHREEAGTQVRWMVAGMVACLTSGWCALFFPIAARFENGEVLTFGEALTQRFLMLGILVGGVSMLLALYAPKSDS